MGEITIKEYTNDYKQAVIDLILHIQREEFYIPITKDDQPDLEKIPDFYQTGNGNFWIACYDKQLVGIIALIDIKHRQGALRKMFVQQEFRGKQHGIAGLLLQSLMTWSARHNINKIYLGTTEKFLAAHRFYEKNGFKRIEKDMLPDTFPLMTVDTRFYSYALKP